MDAVEFLKETNRMCGIIRKTKNCFDNCKLSAKRNGIGMVCRDYIFNYPYESVEIVKSWSKEHPQRTIFDVLKEKYPNVEVDSSGVPTICAKTLGIVEKCQYRDACGCETDCIKCWNTPVKEVE